MEQYGAEYEGKTDTMIFWRAFDAVDTNAGSYVESVELDSINGYVDPGKWKFCKPNNNFSKADGTKLVIYYTEPAYLTIINNTTHKLVENNNMMVHGMRVYNGYGYIVEIGDDGTLTYTDMPSNSALNLESVPRRLRGGLLLQRRLPERRQHHDDRLLAYGRIRYHALRVDRQHRQHLQLYPAWQFERRSRA